MSYLTDNLRLGYCHMRTAYTASFHGEQSNQMEMKEEKKIIIKRLLHRPRASLFPEGHKVFVVERRETRNIWVTNTART